VYGEEKVRGDEEVRGGLLSLLRKSMSLEVQYMLCIGEEER
jgi:hypothetical protein